MPESLAIHEEEEERMSEQEIRMAAIHLVSQLPLQKEDALKILDFTRRFAMECLFKRSG